MTSALRQFNVLLKKHALIGSMCVYGAMSAGGDQVRQIIQRVPETDFGASGRMAVVGGAFLAPGPFKWYQWLDKTYKGTTLKIVLKKVVLDQVVATPFCAIIFYTGLSILERQENIFEELQAKGVKTYLTGCLFWPVVQVMNFRFAPPYARTSLVASAGFVWCIVLSFFKSSDFEREGSKITQEEKSQE